MKKALRYAGLVFGVVVFVVCVAIAVGTGLPISHTARCEAAFDQSPSVLWDAMYDDATTVKWRTDIARVEPVASSHGAAWREFDRYGHSITYRTTGAERPKMFRRIIDDSTLPFGGSWTVWVVPAGKGASVEITERGEIYNPIFRLLSAYVFGYMQTMTNYLHDLGGHFGESPKIDCAKLSS